MSNHTIGKQNQAIPPSKHSQKYRAFYKSGNSSMLVAKNISYAAARVLEYKIKQFLESHESKLEGHFIVTR